MIYLFTMKYYTKHNNTLFIFLSNEKQVSWNYDVLFKKTEFTSVEWSIIPNSKHHIQY